MPNMTDSLSKSSLSFIKKLALLGFGLLLLVLAIASMYFFRLPKIPNVYQPSNFVSQDLQILQQKGLYADQVFVKKSTRTMQLLHQGQIIREYRIALGDKPQGHKQQEGDEHTPEGWYTLDWANENSKAYRSLHISYPNAADIANAKSKGISPGGAIMIHGQFNGLEKFTPMMQQRDWTNGCIAVTNPQMDEIMALVKVGTPIFIEW